VQHGFAVHQRLVQLVEFRGVSASGLSERYFSRAGVTVDVDAGWRLPHLPILARHDEEPEVVQKTRPVGRGCSSGRSGPLRIQRALLFRSSLVSHPGGDVLPSLDAALQRAADPEDVRKENRVSKPPLRVAFVLTLNDAALDDAILEGVEADHRVLPMAALEVWFLTGKNLLEIPASIFVKLAVLHLTACSSK
jgi:hypothetical protein